MTPTAFEVVRAALRGVASHTALPVVVVASASIVLGARLVRRSARWALEIAVVAALLAIASHLGWLRL